MANGNLTKKEPKIVENHHKSFKKSQKSSKRAKKLSKIAINGRKGPKIVEKGQKNTNLDFKKTGKKHNKQEIQDMGVALL